MKKIQYNCYNVVSNKNIFKQNIFVNQLLEH